MKEVFDFLICIMAALFSIGVFGIIVDDQERVLLVHRNDYDMWNLPGGWLEENEVPWDWCIHQIKEETGLDVEIERLLGIYSKTYKSDIVMNFLCTVVGGVLTLNEEARDLQYFTLGQLPKILYLSM